MLTGQPMSALLAAPERKDDGLPYRFVPIALEPSDRAVLHARIEQRFDAMLEAGFVDEVKRLRARGDLDPNLPSMRCVGYRQVWEYLDGAIDYATMRDKGIFATRQLCKRQLTWLRSMPERVVIDCCASNATEDAVAAIEAVLAGNEPQ
jgi:tRNA dimethylallyltransferase